MSTPRARSIVDVVRRRADSDAGRPAYTYLSKEGARTLTYAALDARVRAIASVLGQRLARGERALLMYASGLEFIETFWACMYAGLVPVPVYPPNVNGHGLSRLKTIAADSGAGLVLATNAHLNEVSGLLHDLAGDVPALATDIIPDDAALDWQPIAIAPGDTALLQYSSGSTASPKGIVVSHRNILANQEMVKKAFVHSKKTTFAGWLPFFHDMGLFGGIVQPMFVGAHSVLMPPAMFLQQPIRWLKAISEYRAHTSGGPNFAYEYCVRRIADEEKDGLDLRCWKRAFNGAEKPRAETLRRFAAAFAQCGFKEEQFYPCYGMAEATLFVSGRDTKNHPEIAQSTANEAGGRVTNVSSGRTWLQQRIAIVDPERRTLCEEPAIGEVWVKGPHIAEGYWRQPGLSEATFGAFLADGSDGPFLRTGDLGFVRDGELFVTGRLKDLVIVRGQNFHPEDIEAAVEQAHAAVDPGGCAAFAVEPRDDRDGGQERLVLLIEAGKRLVGDDAIQAVCDSAAAAVSTTFGIAAAEVLVVRRGTIPKTSSGKIQRFRCREAYLADRLDPIKTTRYEPGGSIRDGLYARLQALLATGTRGAVAIAPEAGPVQMGLDSVRAMQLKHWIESSLGVSVSIADLFEARSIEELVATIERQAASGATTESGATVELDSPEAQPAHEQLSHGQRSLFFEHEKEANAAYNISVAIRLNGPLDASRLTGAVSALLARHSHLAATFVRQGDEIKQIGRPADTSDPADRVERVDASGWSDMRLREEVDRRANLPFDLAASAIRFVSFDVSDSASVLLIVVHHILIDLFSLETLLKELASLYADATGPALPARPASYGAFTKWEAGLLASPRGDDSLAFWRETLAAAPPSLRLPFCSTAAGRGGRRGATREFELDDDLTAAVRSCASREGVTPSIVLLGAYAVLLTHFARERHVTVGASVAGRPGEGFDDAIGYFANILPLPLTIDAAEPFSRVLERVRRLVGKALDHQHYPYPLLTEKLGTQTLGGMPLVSYAFTYAQARDEHSALGLLREDGGAPIPFGPLRASAFPVERRMAPFDITLMMLDWGGRLHGAFTYAGNRVDPEAMGTVADVFPKMLAALVRQTTDPILRLEPDAAASERTEPAFTSILQRFERQALANPDAIALVHRDEQVTYRTLNARAERLGAYLRGLGIGSESIAAVHCPRGVSMIVGILGVLKAGGAYLPVDITYPAERLRFVIEDARAAVVVTPSEIAAACEGAAGSFAPVTPDPNGLAYVIYTSGSTGTPKGVAVTHANVSRLFDSTRDHVAFGAEDTWTLLHSISFDFSVWELWGALAYGGRLIVLDRDDTRDPIGLRGLITEQHVTVLSATPSALYNLLPPVGDAAASDLPLRYVVTGGEALNASHLAAWFGSTWSACVKLVNMYGITETTVHTTAVELRHGQRLDESTSDIGRPLSDVELYVLDAGHHRVPPYALGELGVGGAGLARGYLFKPALTASRFIPNPFSTAVGARLYLSGDLAYQQGEGRGFRYVGRIDTQVKVRGHRIELSDIEANLRRCDGVDWTMVTAPPGPDGSTVLTAYLVCRGDVTVTGLREHLGRLIPDYMVPARLFRIDAVPTNENGKVDVARLQREAAPLATGETYAPPVSDAERTMARIWAEVLDVERVGLDDNYFALGGDSIRSLQIVAKARKAGLNIDLPRLLATQTVRRLTDGLVEHFAGGLAGDPALTAAPGQSRCEPFELVNAEDRGRLPEGLDDAYPAPRLLQGLIFHSEFSDDYQVYVTSALIGLPCDRQRLEEAIRAAVDRHPFLRSSIDTGTYSEPLQLVHKTVDVEIVCQDIRDRRPAEQERHLRAWIEAEKLRKFDWRRAPLVRFGIHWRDAESFQLTLSDPYLDGWCVALLYREVLATYRTLLRGAALPSREPTTIGQRHFVALERHALSDTRTREFWRQYLDGCPASEVAAGSRQATPQHPHDRESVVISGAVLASIDALAKAASAPPRSVLMAVHGLVLSSLLEQPEVAFGVIHNGRPEEGDGDRAIGSFLNTVPFRLAALANDPAESWIDYTRRVFDAERRVVPHRRFPFAEIRTMHGRVPFDTVFNFTHFHVLDAKHEDDALGIREIHASEQTYFPLTVHFNRSIVSGALECLLDYDCRRLSRAQVENLAGAYVAALDALTGDIAALDGVARTAEIVASRLFPVPKAKAAAEACEEPVPDSFLALFDRIAVARPDAIALVEDDRCVTYRQLRQSAEALARRLRRDLTVGPDHLIGVDAAHSCHTMIGILGILKAGAAYVPLDEDCPAERLSFIMADCRMKAVVAEQALARRFEPFRVSVFQADQSPGNRHRDSDAAGGEDGAFDADAAALAYVIYTSGSTGTPKGVGVSHRSVASLARSAIREYGIVPDDRVLQFCTLEFDISVEEIVMALCAGATLVLRPRDLMESYDAFHAYVAREGITCLNVPTAFWNDWVHELVTTGRPFDLPVRQVIIAGEQMRPELAWQWTNVVPPHVLLVNTYGPTEATVKATIYPVHMTERPAACGQSQSSPIGVGFGETTIAVLDERLRPAGPGVYGELYLRGPQVARGYLNRPRLTAERFVPDRWSALPGATCYRTGDIAFLGEDGGVQFVGRRDRQVKITGYRVEPEELESALMDCAGVRQAAVVVSRSESGAALLEAFVRMEGEAIEDLRATEQQLRERLAARVPRYMMPSSLHFVDRLPMTLSGKIDRGRLAALPALESRQGDQAHDAAIHAALEVISTVYAECLGAPAVPSDADFFSLGGDSLTAMRVASRLREALRCDVSVNDIFEHPRADRLARVVQPRLPAGELVTGAPSAPEEQVLSFSQERLWMSEQLAPMAAAYNIPAAIVIKGRLDAAAFEQSVDEVKRRHHVLRTRVVMSEGRPVPVLSDTPEAPRTTVAHVDMTAMRTGAARATRDDLIDCASRFARARFDLERDAPIRIALCTIDANEHLLLIAIHHIAADGWSIGLLINELLTLYSAYRRGEPSPLQPLTAQYIDYARRQRAKLQGAHRQQLREYWLQALSDMPDEIALPLDYVRPATNDFKGERYDFAIPHDVVDAIAAFGRAESVTPFIILLSAYMTLLHLRSGQTDLVVGTPVSTRDWEDTEGLIGAFVNQLTIRADLAGRPTSRQLVRRVRNAVLSAYDHRELPFEDLVQMLRPRRGAASLPLVQTIFAYRDRPWQDVEIDGLDVEYLDVHNGAAKFDLEVQVIDGLDGGYRGYFEYNTSLFSAATIHKLAADYCRTLHAMVEQRDRSIASLSGLPVGMQEMGERA